MMTLYDMTLSGNCYKVRLLLSLLGESYTRKPVDLAAGDNLRPDFIRLNPRGEIPILVDGDTVVWDSHAILDYIATTRRADAWLTDDFGRRTAVQQWLAVAAHEIQYGLAAARACIKFGRPGDLDQLQAVGIKALALVDQRLEGREWLAAERPTIADLACYPYVRCAEDGKISLDGYDNIRRWFRRIESLDNYVAMTEDARNIA